MNQLLSRWLGKVNNMNGAGIEVSDVSENKSVIKAVKAIRAGEDLSRGEVDKLFSPEVSSEDLMFAADVIRRCYKGNKVSLCGVVNAKSGLCGENCRFCSQSVHHTVDVQQYPLMTKQEMLDHAKAAVEMNASHFGIVTSGKKNNDTEIDTIQDVIAKITVRYSIGVDASLGTLSSDQLKKLKKAGLKRYHHNLETSGNYFPNICTTHSYADRVETVKNAKKAGLEVCSGALFGLGETWSDRLDVAFLLRDLDVDSIPLNFLNPIPGTPLEKQKMLSPGTALRIISLFRLVLPRKDIRICGGREVVFRDLQSWIFFAGANGMMVGNYLTTKGRSPSDDLQMIEDLGLETEVR